MSEDSRLTETIVALIQETQDRRLNWQLAPSSEVLNEASEDVVDVVYMTVKNGRHVRVFSYKSKFYTDEDEWGWHDYVALEISDLNGRSWWRFPQNRVIWDLLDAVKFATVGVDVFISQVLMEHKEKL